MRKPQNRFFKKKKHFDRPRSQTGGGRPHGHGGAPHGKPQPPRQVGGGPLVEGVLQHKGKFGFVLSEDPAVGDVLIQGPSLKLAMPDDRVRARVTSPSDALRRSGEIVAVLAHARQTVVGAFKRLGNMAVVAPDEEEHVRILDMGGFSPKVNDIVVARITRWPSHEGAAAGNLVEVLGPRDTPGVDLDAVIRRYELPNEFPAEVATEANSFGSEVQESAWKDRALFDRRVFTIDGADAKDFDDAVSVEKISTGWRLGVHIADVAHYVREGSPLDQEARKRGTSVYFTGTVVPMLPFPLSDNLCSLRPDTIRLTMSCLMEIDRDGRVGNYQVLESAIKSSRRFTYEQVEEILKDGNPLNLSQDIVEDVREMGRLARLLREKRFARGSLDFDFPEPEVVTGLNGRPIDIKRRERLEAHRLIEDFMVLANEAVARHMKGHPFLYRIHETPDPARMEKLKKSLEALGIRMPADASKPQALRGVLIQSEKTPLQPVVHKLVLRSLMQAIYSPVNKGHYGLASECYTHFTSPIRRYPDLIVHRRLKERIHGEKRDAYWNVELPKVCEHTSKRERVAVEAEREFMDIQKTRLMEPHVGKEYAGVISSVTNFGLFIELSEVFVEGLVHITNLGNDYYLFDEARMVLRGRRTGKVFMMGQKVRVRIAAANILKHQLDFELLSSESGPRQHAPPAAQGAPRPPQEGQNRPPGGSRKFRGSRHRRR